MNLTEIASFTRAFFYTGFAGESCLQVNGNVLVVVHTLYRDSIVENVGVFACKSNYLYIW